MKHATCNGIKKSAVSKRPGDGRSRSRARLPAPTHARSHGAREPFSKESDEVEVGPKNGKMIVKPLIGAAEFKSELKGCVEISKIDPLEAKRI